MVVVVDGFGKEGLATEGEVAGEVKGEVRKEVDRRGARGEEGTKGERGRMTLSELEEAVK